MNSNRYEKILMIEKEIVYYIFKQQRPVSIPEIMKNMFEVDKEYTSSLIKIAILQLIGKGYINLNENYLKVEDNNVIN